MRRFLMRLKKAVLRSLWVVVPLACLYVLLAEAGLIWTPNTCVTDTIQTLTNLSGYDFKVTETDCSTLGEDASVSVYVSLASKNKAVLLFKYDPAGLKPYPSIAVPKERRVSISVPVISEVFLQRHDWHSPRGSVSVDYHIGRIIYPSTSEPAPE
jgi:hypothetical protein